MARYLVSLTRAVYEYAEVDIEADDQDSAEALALQMADMGVINTWEPVDGGEPGNAVVIGSDAVPA